MLTAEERDALVFEHMEYAEKETAAFLKSVRKALATEKFVGAAYTGLVLAARTYNPESGEPFKAHAWTWVLEYLSQQFQKEWRTESKAASLVVNQRGLFDNTATVRHNTMLAQSGVLAEAAVADDSRDDAKPVASVPSVVDEQWLDAVCGNV